VENLSTGAKVGYSGNIGLFDPPVIIDTEHGTATQGGSSRTHLVTGGQSFYIDHGSHDLRLTAFGASDDGDAEVCWRPAVESG
jgi:hypothetical protein